MHIGFILTKTPAEEGFNTFLEFVSLYLGKERISIYLLGNGVFCARKGHSKQDEIENLIGCAKIYANSSDLMARGISEENLIEGIKSISGYDGLVVDIMENFDQVLSF